MGMQVIKEKTMFKRRLSQTLIGLSMAGFVPGCACSHGHEPERTNGCEKGSY